MNFSSYAAFRNAVVSLIDGDDVSQSDLSVASMDLMIGTGEIRLYRDIRSSTQDTALTLTVTNNVAALPADFLELRTVYAPNNFPASYVPEEVMQQLIQKGANVSNAPLRYGFEGDSLIFYPALNGVTLSGRYYKRFADIATGINALLTRHPDLFIYAALAESGPFLGEDTRLQIWEAKYASLVKSANEQERRRITRGSKLAMRVA